jgi:hypothetical protein
MGLGEGIGFQNARAIVRTALTETKVAPRIDAVVAKLLGGRGSSFAR